MNLKKKITFIEFSFKLINNLKITGRKKLITLFQIFILPQLPFTPLAKGFWIRECLLFISVSSRYVSQHGVEHSKAL
jgi:hypothetical protein